MAGIFNNKRADIAIVLLVVGILAVCVTALISFAISQAHVQNSFINTGVFTGISVQMENFYFYVNSGKSVQEAAKIVGGIYKNNQIILSQEQKNGKQEVMNVTYIVDLNKR